MTKFKKMMSVTLAGCMAASALMMSAGALSSQTPTDCVASNAVTVEKILDENPNALIFTSEEDAEHFFDELAGKVTVTEETENIVPMSTGEYNAPVTIKTSLNLVGKLELHYYWTRTSGGRNWGKQYAEPNISMSGYTPGIDLDLVSASFYKATSNNLKGSYYINFKYYLLVDGGIPLPGWKTMRYDVSHTTGVDPTVTATKL